ncbi:MAG TPA: YceH family protein [Candidatus Acidoferrales bacterium]
MDIKITDVEARVLGALIEKEITTPEYYPLSLNALVNACNQKSNREPVMELAEGAVVAAMRALEAKEFAGAANTTDSRVRKYEHRLQEVFNFTRPETAVLCVLLLRGAQTPGEIRGRAERLHHFEALEDVQLALGKLMKREPAMAAVLPRQPGTKESRYLELMSGDAARVAAGAVAPARAEAFTQHIENPAAAAAPVSGERDGTRDGGRVARLEAEVAELRGEMAALKAQFAEFRKQFE